VGLYYITNPALLIASLQELVDRDIRTKGEYQLTDALQLMIDGGVKFRTFNVKGWYDCGKPEALLETNRQLLGKGKQVRRLKGSRIIAPVFVAKSARVEGCVLGPNVSVGEKAHLRNSTIENSIIGQRALVENSTLTSSLVGNRARIERASGSVNVGDSSEIDLS
jgi:glucose-1-phosphate thymidylyltransferase